MKMTFAVYSECSTSLYKINEESFSAVCITMGVWFMNHWKVCFENLLMQGHSKTVNEMQANLQRCLSVLGMSNRGTSHCSRSPPDLI